MRNTIMMVKILTKRSFKFAKPPIQEQVKELFPTMHVTELPLNFNLQVASPLIEVSRVHRMMTLQMLLSY